MSTTTVRCQRGMSLIEALVAVLVFSLGVLGLIGLQATAINLSSDAKYRADAAFLTNQIIGLISISDPANLAGLAHQVGGTSCAPSGAVSSNAAVTGWVSQVNSVFQGASPKQQIKVDTGTKVVIVGLCWKQKDGDQHSQVVTTQIQWQ